MLQSRHVTQINTKGFFDYDSLPKTTTSEKLQFAGITCYKTKSNKISKSDYHKFLFVCEKIVKSDAFIAAFYLIEMDITAWDTKTNFYINNDGSRAVIHPDHVADKSITNKKDIQYRAIMSFAFKTDLSKVELENRFGNIFCFEGELPKRW